MTKKYNFLTSPLILIIAATGLLILASACRPSPATPVSAISPTADTATSLPSPTLIETPVPPTLVSDLLPSPTVPAATPDAWQVLLQEVPYPYTTPLPARTSTVLDNTYAKIEPKEGTPVPCRRCPDYLPEGGAWRLNLDQGIFRIFHTATGWRSLGSFTLSGNRLFLFNDPACFDTVGTYEWELNGGELKISVIEDTCQVDRRARSFTHLPWLSCQPRSVEAAATDHWPRPDACEVASAK